MPTGLDARTTEDLIRVMAMAEGAKEATYFQNFLKELGKQQQPIILYNDNQGAGELVKNPVFHSRTEHIDIWHRTKIYEH